MSADEDEDSIEYLRSEIGRLTGELATRTNQRDLAIAAHVEADRRWAEERDKVTELKAKVRELEDSHEKDISCMDAVIKHNDEQRDYRDRLDGYMRSGNMTIKEALEAMREVDEEVRRAT